MALRSSGTDAQFLRNMQSIQSLKEKLKELETADQNVDAILQMQIPEPTQQKTKSKEYER